MLLKNIFQYDIICSMYVSSFQHWSVLKSCFDMKDGIQNSTHNMEFKD